MLPSSVPLDNWFLFKELHLDLDGLYADFVGGVRRLTGKHPDAMKTEDMWAKIDADPYFFEQLQLLPGSEKLWAAIRDLPVPKKFLTGKLQTERFNSQKRIWVGKTFGNAFEVNIVPSEEKQKFSREGMVLIDDDAENIARWNAKGGHGIQHTGSYSDTIEKLFDYVKGLSEKE